MSQPPLKKKKAGGASMGRGAGKGGKTAAAAAASPGSKKPRAGEAVPKKEPIIVAELAEVFGGGTIDVYKEAFDNCYSCDDSADMDELLGGWEKGAWKK